MSKQLHPPRWANRVLEWYCRPDLLEEIQGDAFELFYRTSRESERKAKLTFIWNVLRFFRWKNIRKEKSKKYSPNSLTMLRSYLLSGIRNIQRNLVPASINIIGLSIALGCGVTIFLILNSYYNLDSFHEKSDRIYLLMNKVKSGDNISNWASSPYLLGPALKDEHASLEAAVRVQHHGGISVRQSDQVFNETVWFVDDAFLNTFSFPVVSGSEAALRDKTAILISREMAEKYFGTTDPINKELSFKFWSDQKRSFFVRGVFDSKRDLSSMFINFLIPMEVWEDLESSEPMSWRNWTSSTFVLMQEGHQPEELLPAIQRHKKTQNEANEKFAVESVEFIPLNDVAQRAFEISNCLSWGNIPAAMIAFAVVAVLLVLLACFNYMNVAVASVSTRLKEIGIRKVVGGGKKEIIFQFLTENILLCALALLGGTAIAYFLLVPGFNSLYPIDIPFTFSSTQTLISFFAGTLLLVALVSGGYPAFYIASFNPVKILRGKEKFGSKGLLSKVLLTFQFILSFTTIIGGLVFVRSSDYFEDKDWGYDHAQTFFVPLLTSEQFLKLKDAVAQNKNVITYAGAEGHVGYQNQVTTVRYREIELNTGRFGVGFDYLQAMGLRLKEGRFFDRAIQSDHVESIVVNEAFIKKLNIQNPLNEFVEFDSTRYTIVGVVEDFYLQDFYSNVEPSFFHIAPELDFRYLVVKAEAGSGNAVGTFLNEQWKKVAPDDPYRGRAQDEVFASFYNANRSNNKVLYTICFVALALACMGLYGLVSYNLTRRFREFSVRKVFGASVFHIFKLMNRDYLPIVIFSFAVGAPLGYYSMGLMLTAAYPEKIPVGIGPFAITISIMVVTVAATILSQLNRVTKESPVNTLRIE